MFKFKLVVVVLALASCSSPTIESPTTPHHQIEVVSKTDSILGFADSKMSKIKQHQVEQKGHIDSLLFEIDAEHHLIDDIQIKLIEKIGVEEDLKLTEHELEAALIQCRKKEKELTELNEAFALRADDFMDEVEYYISREAKLITAHIYEVDSLKKVIKTLKKELESIPPVKKKKKRKKKSKPS